MTIRPFTIEEERYLVARLSSGDDRSATKALQWLCNQVRGGAFITDPARTRSTIMLCLFRESHAVKRWAVNALTAIGVGGDISPILNLLSAAENDPDLLVSVIACIFSQKPDVEASTILAQRGVEMEGLALIAASRFSINQKQRLVETRIPLDTASPEELRAAIVLAGMGKSPEHLFHGRHTNAIALSELNLHHVPSVSKYSIWALAELKLGYSSLQLPISSLEASAPEVRKWFLRLLFSDAYALKRHLDLVQYAQTDASTEVREEAAMELRGTYVEGLSTPVRDWFFNEVHEEARYALLEHMAAQSIHDDTYRTITTEFYRRALLKSDTRNRVEAAAAGTPLFRELRKIALVEESVSLFSNDNEFAFGDRSVTNINQNFNNSQIGAVSASGNISAETLAAVNEVKNSSERELLLSSLTLISQLQSSDARREGERLVATVAGEPEKSKWQRLIGFLKGAREGAQDAKGLTDGIDGLIGNIQDIANLG
jgi:hypothetical protein